MDASLETLTVEAPPVQSLAARMLALHVPDIKFPKTDYHPVLGSLLSLKGKTILITGSVAQALLLYLI